MRFFLNLIFVFTCFFAPLAADCSFQKICEEMKRIEKSELHLHLGGAWPLDYLKSISKPQQFAELTEMLDQIQKGMGYHEVFQVFTLINQIVDNDQKVEDGVAALCTHLKEDNVVYAEFRTGLKNLGSGEEGCLIHILNGIKRGTEGSNLKVGLLLSVRRDTPIYLAEKTIELAIKYKDQGVAGIDISGDSTKGNIRDLLSTLLKAKKYELPITLHIGESNKESSELQMLELATLQPKRIGHGVHLCEAARKWVEENNVLVELCLSSACMTRMIHEPSDHPALNLFLKGHAVAICTDDPLVFNTTLSQEYARVALVTGLTPERIEAIQKENVSYFFSR